MAITKIRGNVQIMAGTITNAEVNASAAIVTTKLADGAKFIQSDGSVAFTADQPMGSKKITGLAAPSSGTDAANKDYVDSAAAGLDPKESVRATTTANITLTNLQTIDGVSLAAADRVLVKDQSAGDENGIYDVVDGGAWTRSSDADTSAEVTAGMFCWVEEGTANADSGWVLTTNDPIILDTTALVFTQFSGAGQITAGTGLTKTGNTIDAIGGNGITANADDLAVDPDGSTLSVGAGGVKIADAGVTETQLHTSVAGNGLTGGGGSVLAVGGGNGITANADDVAVDADGGTLTVAAAGVKVSDAGITETQLNTSIAGGGLTGGGGAVLAVGAGNGVTVNADDVTINLDGTTLEVGVGGLKVKAAGITGTEVNTSVAGNGLAGGGGSALSVDIITRETPSGLVNGSNTTYTLANTPVAGTEMVFLNGILQEPGAGNDYTISTDTITYLTAPVSGDKIRVTYFK